MLLFFENLKQILSLYFVVPAVLILGVYFTCKFRFIQFTKIPYAWKILTKKNRTSKNSVSSFTALAAVLGGNLGTGNIAGIAFGLTTGGPGALFWMWVMALLGAIIKFAGCFLGVKYRIKDSKTEGGNTGGPMYYLNKGLNLPIFANLFCVFCILGAFTVGNLVQVNSITLPLNASGINPIASGIIMAILVAYVLLKGKQSFLHVSAKIVPVMAIIYILSCLTILGLYSTEIIPAIKAILTSAFNPYSVGGGIGAFYIMDAVKSGFDRGLFATDAGIGLAPILHSEVTSKDEVNKTAFDQGMIATLAPIIVMFICTITGLTLMVTGVWQNADLQSTNMCIKSFQVGLGSNLAGHIVTITLWFFAFTTILTWAHCSEKAFHYLFPKVEANIYRIIFILFVPLGAIFSVAFVWSIADITINIMLLLNLIGVVGLSKKVSKDAKKFI